MDKEEHAILIKRKKVSSYFSEFVKSTPRTKNSPTAASEALHFFAAGMLAGSDFITETERKISASFKAEGFSKKDMSSNAFIALKTSIAEDLLSKMNIEAARAVIKTSNLSPEAEERNLAELTSSLNPCDCTNCSLANLLKIDLACCKEGEEK